MNHPDLFNVPSTTPTTTSATTTTKAVQHVKKRLQQRINHRRLQPITVVGKKLSNLLPNSNKKRCNSSFVRSLSSLSSSSSQLENSNNSLKSLEERRARHINDEWEEDFPFVPKNTEDEYLNLMAILCLEQGIDVDDEL